MGLIIVVLKLENEVYSEIQGWVWGYNAAKGT